MTRVRHDPSIYDRPERDLPEGQPLRDGSYRYDPYHDPTMQQQSWREQSNDGQPQDQRTLGELVGELTRETRTLVRQEVQLARLELKKRATEAARNAALLAAGGLVLYAGALALIATAIIALAEVMEPWLAALIVGVLVTALGGFLLYYGYNQLTNLDMTPRRTVETLQENAEWLKREVS